jgi:hypothetical protein
MINLLTGLTIISTSDGGKSVAKTLKAAQKREKMKLVATSADSEATRTQIPIHCGQHSDDCGQLMMTC